MVHIASLHSSIGKAIAGFAVGIVVEAIGTKGAVLGAPEGLLALALTVLLSAASRVAVVSVALASWKEEEEEEKGSSLLRCVKVKCAIFAAYGCMAPCRWRGPRQA